MLFKGAVCAQKQSRKRLEDSFVVLVRVPDLGFHKLDLLWAFSPVEGIRNNVSSTDENIGYKT